MTLKMMGHSQHDYLKSYQGAIAQLSSSPKDRDTQHMAVLSLARMGSLDFALSEYDRYDLASVRHHEDIMALGGRLSKDLYLMTTGKVAIRHAQDSAQKYEAAYQDTKGYYSGINAATMSFLADTPKEIILSRIEHIQTSLPATENLTPTDYYFIEATRAECFLLREEISKAKACLRSAINFDPLNYSAHAATLKQFRLILKKQKNPLHWLKDFTPPRPVHFAGHIWKNDAPPFAPNYETMLTQVADIIQQKDIGYGYGALAAGADIIIAEVLIQEGAELHVTLPCDIESFIEYSVRPFGEDWVPRFKSCIEEASSIKTLNRASKTPQRDSDFVAAQVSMGQAIIKGRQFDVEPEQLLLLDENATKSMTANQATTWESKNLSQNVLPISVHAKNSASKRIKPKPIAIKVGDSKTKLIDEFESLNAAIDGAYERLSVTSNQTVAMHYATDDAEDILKALTAKKIPNSILVSDCIASTIALENDKTWNVTYAGVVNIGKSQGIQNQIHIYTLRTIK